LKGNYLDIKITSPAFDDGGLIPKKYTCDGGNVLPPLRWDAVPPGTESIAIICEDPDAPSGVWVHWILFNLPAECRELTENLPDDETLPDGTRQGVNDFGSIGYGGPCPPWGIHRYFFRIFALDHQLDIVHLVDKDVLKLAMEGHILAAGQLMGRYQRK
jgi:Raf kinase inhibitor-like YbhB/YbcL family protein